MKHIVKRIILIFFLLASLCITGYNNFFNDHYHILLNGRVIFHAHPYENTDAHSTSMPAHSHTPLELLCYDSVGLLVFILVLYCLATLVSFEKAKHLKWIDHVIPHQIHVNRFLFRRGPPAVAIP